MENLWRFEFYVGLCPVKTYGLKLFFNFFSLTLWRRDGNNVVKRFFHLLGGYLTWIKVSTWSLMNWSSTLLDSTPGVLEFFSTILEPLSDHESDTRKRVEMDEEKAKLVTVINVDEDMSPCIKSIIGKGNNKFNAISVEDYSEHRDLHLAIMASILPSNPNNFIDLSGDIDDDDEICVVRFKSSNTRFGKDKRRRSEPLSFNSTWETGHSNSKNDPSFLCHICVEPKTANEWFNIKGCSHCYCTDCIAKYVATKLQENVSKIGCPVSDCNGCLEPEYCRNILPAEVFNRWGDMLCEAVIPGSEKFYCPFKDCSMMLIDDGKEKVVESECPSCSRLFCAQCKVPWHSQVDCAEFQKLNKDEREREDIMLMKLAQTKFWKRCPNCKIYVEKSHGCLFMTCRCGSTFCYRCGNPRTHNQHYHCPHCEK